MAPASSSEHLEPSGPPAGEPIPPALLNSPDYEIVRELSRGGMGVVYLVRNRRMDRLECLKVVKAEFLKRSGARERFEREMRSAARVNHPHIVTAYSAPHLEGLLAFAMEYVDGIDLARFVAAHGPLPVSNACYYIHQAARALQYAHEKSLVHRDIKPGNLMLARDGNRDVIKILDFGLAKATSESPVDGALTEPGQMLGTPHYMAPEQIKDAGKADVRADIYSLGCTLYYLLTGAGPFQNKATLYELLHAQQFELSRPLNEVRTDVPAELAGVVAKMMAKDPLHRYQDPGAAAQAIAPFFQQGLEPISHGGEGDGGQVPARSSRPVEAETLSSMRSPTALGTAVPPALPRSDLVPTVVDDPVARIPQPIAGNRMNAPDRGPARSGKPRTIWGRVVFAALLLGAAVLWWIGVIDVKTKYGALVLDVNEPNADVYVDGAEVDVSWAAGGRQAEIQIKTGDRRVEISKDGFTVASKDLTIKEGESQEFKALLRPMPKLPTGGLPPGAAASSAATAAPTGAASGQQASATADENAAAGAPAATSTSTSEQTAPSLEFEGHAPGEVRDDNSLHVKLAWCPPGKFTMGSPHHEKDRGANEEQVSVTLTRGFWLGTCEVTQGQWSQLMGTTPWKGEANVQDGPEFPVTFVHWEDSQAFCRKLTLQERTAGRLPSRWEYALPTEAQWEYACRAGTTSVFSFGDDSPRLAEFGWFKSNTIDAGEKYAHTVRQKQPNPWGLYDLHGNTFEWCRDSFTDRLKGGPDPWIATGGTQRVYRGGGWFNTPQYCRSAIRRGLDPTFKGNALGFRIACIPAVGG